MMNKIDPIDRELIVIGETEAAGLNSKSWGFRSGVRDGLAGDYCGLCDPGSWPRYDDGFKIGAMRALC